MFSRGSIVRVAWSAEEPAGPFPLGPISANDARDIADEVADFYWPCRCRFDEYGRTIFLLVVTMLYIIINSAVHVVCGWEWHVGEATLLWFVCCYVYHKSFGELQNAVFNGRIGLVSFRGQPSAVAIEWPKSEDMHRATDDRDDHLRKGLTRFALRDALTKLLPDYVRNEAWIGSVSEEAKTEVVGYDLNMAIKAVFRESELDDFSVCEVLGATDHPGIGTATVFVSHVQMETLKTTLKAIKRYSRQYMGMKVKFWLDYVCLRQCRSDFTLERVAALIADIGETMMIAESWGAAPLALSRIYCIFEVHATLKSGADFLMCSGRPMDCRFRIPLVQVRMEEAEIRPGQEDTKAEILAKFQEPVEEGGQGATGEILGAREDEVEEGQSGGISRANRLCEEKIIRAFRGVRELKKIMMINAVCYTIFLISALLIIHGIMAKKGIVCAV